MKLLNEPLPAGLDFFPAKKNSDRTLQPNQTATQPNQTMNVSVSMNTNVGQASRLPSERASESAKANLSSASPRGAGETPALLYRRFGSAAPRATKACRKAPSSNLPSESGSKLHARQTLARSCCALPLREAFGVRPACRRFGFRSPRRELLRGILSLPLSPRCAAERGKRRTTMFHRWKEDWIQSFQGR